MRGLKRTIAATHWVIITSHLIRVRGLKLLLGSLGFDTCIAPYTGAWIETITRADDVSHEDRTLYGCVD